MNLVASAFGFCGIAWARQGDASPLRSNVRRALDTPGRRCSSSQTAFRRCDLELVIAFRIEKRSRESISTGTTCDTRRCHDSQATAFRFTSRSCAPVAPVSRRRNAT
jgi:hypothetical protein